MDQKFEVELKHHLNMEGELIEKGLIQIPVAPMPEPAKGMPPVKIVIGPRVIVKRRIQNDSSPIVVKGRAQRAWSININRITP